MRCITIAVFSAAMPCTRRIRPSHDDFGKDYLAGLKEALGERADIVVEAQSYEVSDPTIDSQIVSLRSAGADVVFTIATPKHAAQSMRKIAELGWKPTHFVVAPSSSISSILSPAGLDASTGMLTAMSNKGVKEYLAFMREWYPEGDPTDAIIQTGYSSAQLAEIILRNCGDDLTRENVLKQATGVDRVSLPLMLPVITVSLSPTDYSTFSTFKLAKFDGRTGKFFGENIGSAPP